MKTIIDYINENIIGIYEASFSNTPSNNEWIKHNYKYAKNVIQNIITNKSIVLGKNDETSKTIDFTNLSENELNELISNLKNIKIEVEDGYVEFNKIMKKYGVEWNKIFKTPYSGGSTSGGNAEVIVCYLFNNPNTTDDELSSLCTKYKVDPNTWVTSIKNTVNVINKTKKWKYPEYVALQVDGKGTEHIKGESIGNLSKNDAVSIATLFYDKASINKELGNDLDVSKLYSKKKDEWNKADIVLIKTDKNYLTQIKSEFDSSSKEFKYDGLEGFKKMTVDYTLDNIIIPISLKATPDDSAQIYKHNIGGEDTEKIFGVEHTGNNADIELPAGKLKGDGNDDDKSGSIYLVVNNNKKQTTTGKYMGKKTENAFNIQFYKRASSSNLKPTAKVELALKNSKGGSGFQQMCNALHTTTSQCYATPERVKTAVTEYFGWDINNLPDNVKSANNWYMKPCFTCLIGLLDLFVKEKVSDVPTDKRKILLPFANFAIGACEGDGAYYIIK